MTRRSFLALGTVAPAALRAAPRKEVRITAIRLAPIEGRFHRFIAMNAYDEKPKGTGYTNTLVRIETDQGIEGIGVMGYRAPEAALEGSLRTLLNVDPRDVFEYDGAGFVTAHAPAYRGVMTNYRWLDGPLLDLVGKLGGKPCWQLLGSEARETVEVYDGQLYFSDVWFKDKGLMALMQDAEESARKGYRAMKFKVGRGYKWMERGAGLKRDIEVLETARAVLGDNFKIMADANNGYRDDFDGGCQFLAESREAELFWIEEIFPEDSGWYGRLRDVLVDCDITGWIADGESIAQPADFLRYLKPARLIDVLQMDIRTGGFVGNLEVARLAEQAGAVTVPHNWGSQIGFLMALHFAKAVKVALAAEDDRSTCDAIEPDGYEFSGGRYSVSNAPGLGIRLDQQVYSAKYKSGERVIS